MHLPPSTKLVIGLGNPGSRFSNTRHNVGWLAVERLARQLGVSGQEDRQAQATIYVAPRIQLMTPLIFMNDVGLAVAAVMAKSNLKPENILVIHDDLDLRPGEMKLKEGGSASGHNGVRSIIACLKTDKFPRLRLGIGRPLDHKPTTPEEEAIVSQFVLESFTLEERQIIERVCAEIQL